MVELKGSLDSVGLPSIVQLVGELRHSGRLDLRNQQATASLGFDAGRLVAARLDDHQGMHALVGCLDAFGNGEFVFSENAQIGEHNLDLGPDGLAGLLNRLTNEPERITQPAPAEPPTLSADDDPLAVNACPHLGFADDPARHYSRPTALHRCFATRTASTITGAEQRDLCLSGRYSVCSRFRSVARVTPAAASPAPFAPAAAPAPPARSISPAGPLPPAPPARPISSAGPLPPAGSVSPPSPAPVPPAAPAPSAEQMRPAPPLSPAPLVPREHLPDPPRPAMPPGVAARLAAASQMRLSSSPDEPELEEASAAAQLAGRPDHLPTATQAQHGSAQKDQPVRSGEARPRRGVLLAVGALLGLIVLGAAGVVFVRSFNRGLSPQAQSAAVQAFEPVPTAVRTAADTPATAQAAQARATIVLPAAGSTSVNAAPATRAVNPAAAPPRPTPAPLPAVAAAPAGAQPPAAASSPNGATRSGSDKSLIDIRFAGSDARDWLDNPPFAAFSDGAYRLQARQATHFVAVTAPIEEVLTDLVVSATFRKTGGPPGGGYGLVIRDQSPDPNDGTNQILNAYVLETGDVGEFGVWRRDGDRWVDLVPWTRSSVVRPGGSPNDLTVHAIGDRLTFNVNGTDVASVQDSTLSAGTVGIFVGGDFNEVALDHFAVQVPD